MKHSDIRYQSGPVGRAIAEHKTNDQIKKWEKALEGAGNLVGWDLKNIANGYEFLHHISAKLFFHIYNPLNFFIISPPQLSLKT